MGETPPPKDLPMRRVLLAPLLLLGLLVVPADAAPAGPYAPLDRPGPRLSVPAADLARSLSCSGEKGRPTVVLLPGTGLDPSEFRWNYSRSLPAAGYGVCAVTLPQEALGDIQVAAEHVVSAIREVHRRSGRRVSLLGHSQGGMIGRWALRFWPDTRPLVDDVIGMAPSNHGTVDSQVLCQAQCPPAFWQQAAGSRFTEALNSGAETFAGISYTSIYTRTDEVVVPNLDDTGSSSLRTGRGAITNVALQELCPTAVTEHLGIGTYDPVAYALVVDALRHRGPASPARVPAGVCTQQLAPGVDPVTFPTDAASSFVALGANIARSPQVGAEPPLKRYVLR